MPEHCVSQGLPLTEVLGGCRDSEAWGSARSRAGAPQALQGCTVCFASLVLPLGVWPGGSGDTTAVFLPPWCLCQGSVWQEQLQVTPGGWQEHSLRLGPVCF